MMDELQMRMDDLRIELDKLDEDTVNLFENQGIADRETMIKETAELIKKDE